MSTSHGTSTLAPVRRVDLTNKKVVIVGGVAGGASCAARLRRLSETVHITMLERSPHVSYANCGLPYHIGDVISDRAKLELFTPDSFKARFNVDTRVNAEVVEIDRANKHVSVKSSTDSYKLEYDFLVLSCGAMPFVPPMKNSDARGVFTLRTLHDLDQIMKYLKENTVSKALVVGAGFIGLEVAENLVFRKVQTTVVEKMPQVMPMLDSEIAAYVENELRKNGVQLLLGTSATEINPVGSSFEVKLDSPGSTTPLQTDMIIIAVGVRPDVDLARRAGLKISPTTGGIEVTQEMRCVNDDAIFAVGDSVEIYDRITALKARIALAGPANRQGRVAADVIAGLPAKYPGGLGTSIVKVFDVAAASVGLTEKRAKQVLEGGSFQVAHAVSNNHAGYYPNAKPMLLKAIYTSPDGILKGAQVVGRCEGVDKRNDVLATAIAAGMSVHDLQYLDLSYSPPFGSAKDPVNHLATICVDQMHGLHPTVTWTELSNRMSQAAGGDRIVVVDVRTKAEFDKGAIPGAVLIPLNDLRKRLGELSKSDEIVVYCQVGMRGYLATRVLHESGFPKVRNLMGGYTLFNELNQAKLMGSASSSKSAL